MTRNGKLSIVTDEFIQKASFIIAGADIDITFTKTFKNSAQELESWIAQNIKYNSWFSSYRGYHKGIIGNLYEPATIAATGEIRLIVSDKATGIPDLLNTGIIQGQKMLALKAVANAKIRNGFEYIPMHEVSEQLFNQKRELSRFPGIPSVIDLKNLLLPGEYQHAAKNVYYYTHSLYHEKLLFKEIQEIALTGIVKQSTPFLMSPMLESTCVDLVLCIHTGRARIPGFKDSAEQLNGLQNQGLNYSIVHGILTAVPEAAAPAAPYFTVCTAAHGGYYNRLLDLIAELQRENYNEIKEILVFDLGLEKEQIERLNKIGKVVVCELEKDNPDIVTEFTVDKTNEKIVGWYAWKAVAIKQALDRAPYVLWLDWHTTVYKSLENLFKHIMQNGYFLSTIGDEKNADGSLMHPVKWGTTEFVKKALNLDTPENQKILDKELIMNSVIGMARDSEAYKKILMPIYEKTKEKGLRYFQDDGTAPSGPGAGRWDEPLLSFYAYSQGFNVFAADYTQQTPIKLKVDNKEIDFYMTWNPKYLDQKTILQD